MHATPLHRIREQSRSLVRLLQHFEVVSASANRCAEDVRISAIVIPELKLGDVQRYIFDAYFMERADHAALEDGPEALDGVDVNRADDVLALIVIDRGMWILVIEIAVAAPSVRCEQADLVRHDLIDEGERGLSGYSFQNASDDITLALYSANDWRLASDRIVLALIPMAILVLAADPRFINLDDAAQLLSRLNERRADFVRHVKRGLVGAEPHLSLNLQRTNSLLAVSIR
jgi:hypothetical protein